MSSSPRVPLHVTASGRLGDAPVYVDTFGQLGPKTAGSPLTAPKATEPPKTEAQLDDVPLTSEVCREFLFYIVVWGWQLQ